MPAVAVGTVYVGSQGDIVYALAAADCTEQWRFQTSDGGFGRSGRYEDKHPGGTGVRPV